jgi:signal transduction histidine kinase
MEERVRIAREMHDGLAQVLGLLHMRLQDALAGASHAPALAQALREMVDMTDKAYDDLRRSILELRTFVSRGRGLVPTLTEYLHEFSAQSGISVELDVPVGAFDPLPPPSEVQAVRIIQEALINLRKHARASQATVRLRRDGAWVRSRSRTTAWGGIPRRPPIRCTSAFKPCGSGPKAWGDGWRSTRPPAAAHASWPCFRRASHEPHPRADRR